MADTYSNFAALAASEPQTAWRIVTVDRGESDVLIVAPHAGDIEVHTSAIASAIAGDDFSLYCFEGCKSSGNRGLHITSHRFDEPSALALAARSGIVIGVHGCRGDQAIYVGGLDAPLAALLTEALVQAGLPARSDGHRFPARRQQNICNRGRLGCGAQLEITLDLRMPQFHSAIAGAARQAIRQHPLQLARAVR